MDGAASQVPKSTPPLVTVTAPKFAEQARQTAAELVVVTQEIHFVEDLLALEIPGRPATTKARWTAAVATLSAEQLAEFSRKLAPISSYDSDPLDLVTERWMELAPIPALEFLLPMGKYPYGPAKKTIVEIFKSLPATAIHLLTLFPEEFRGDCLITRGDCIETLQDWPPQQALEFIVEMDAKIRNDKQEGQSMGGHPAAWLKSDPIAAMNWALSQQPCSSRNILLWKMLEAWGQQDAAAARDFFDAVPRSTLPNGSNRNWLRGKISVGEQASHGKKNP